ncbi:MAG TPA: hypothetical protein VG755_10970 [Nannocystaceae bacterium]|nr:hypothetical protein [Nannocystaceae bacterium]
MASRTPALDRLLAAGIRRQRLADAAWGLARIALPAGLVIAALAIVLVRRFGVPELALWSCALPVPAVLAWAWLRPRSSRRVARRLDEHHGLHDRLGAALELLGAKPTDDTRTAAIIELLRAQAESLAPKVDPRPAIPVHVPTPRIADAVGVALLGGALLVPQPRALELYSVPIDLRFSLQTVQARAGLDLALAGPLRQSLRELSGKDDKPAAAAEAILEILDALEKGDIDRALALEKLEQLDKELADAQAEQEAELREDPATLAEALQELAGALEQEEVTADAGKALDKGEGEQAEAELAEAEAEAEASEQSEEQMKRALSDAEKRLGKQQDERESSERAKQLDEAERRLRKEEKKKPETPEEKEEQERRLKKMKKDLEELRRKHERELAAQKKVEELRRNADKASKSKAGSQERKRELEKLGRGMKEASRSARGSQRMQGARDALEEAKTFVRRAGQQGAGEDRRRQQSRRFEKAAKGQQGKEGQGKGKDGKGKGQSTLLVEGEVGEGKSQQMVEMPGQQGEGQEGQGEGQQGEGQQGEGQDGQGEGDQGEGQDGEGEGQEGDGQQGDGSQGMPGSDGIGTGSQDPMGDPSKIPAHLRNVKVNAKRGKGVSKAEVLKDASQRGFASEPYRKMYKEYRDFAQSAIDSDAMNAAQRRLVKRYYQMIQGR